MNRLPITKLLKNRKVLFALQIIITGGVLYYASRHFDLLKISHFYWRYFAVALLLVAANIGLEALKLKIATNHITKISFKKMFMLQLSAANIGFLSPNRIGEPFYKAFVFPKNKRLQAMQAIVQCGIYQLLMTVVSTIIVLFFTGKESYRKIVEIFHKHETTGSIAIGFLGLTLVIYFIYFVVKKKNLPSISLKQHLQLILSSFVRYSVFIAQLYFIFYALGLNLSVVEVFNFSVTYFFLDTIIPNEMLTDLPVRFLSAGAAATIFSVSTNVALQAILILYFLNIILPSVLGFKSLQEYKKYQSALSAV